MVTYPWLESIARHHMSFFPLPLCFPKASEACLTVCLVKADHTDRKYPELHAQEGPVVKTEHFIISQDSASICGANSSSDPEHFNTVENIAFLRYGQVRLPILFSNILLIAKHALMFDSNTTDSYKQACKSKTSHCDHLFERSHVVAPGGSFKETSKPWNYTQSYFYTLRRSSKWMITCLLLFMHQTKADFSCMINMQRNPPSPSPRAQLEDLAGSALQLMFRVLGSLQRPHRGSASQAGQSTWGSASSAVLSNRGERGG